MVGAFRPAVAIVASAMQLGPVQVATLLGEIFAATETSVTAILSTTNINRGGKVRHEAAKAKSATNAIGPDVGKMATASLPPIRFETIGVAIGTMMMFPSTAVGKVDDWHGDHDHWNHWGYWDGWAGYRHIVRGIWWGWATAPLLTSWLTYGWGTPYYWDYGPGEYINCYDDVMYVNGRLVSTGAGILRQRRRDRGASARLDCGTGSASRMAAVGRVCCGAGRCAGHQHARCSSLSRKKA